MRTTSVEVVRIAAKGPSDVSGLLTLSSRQDLSGINPRDTRESRGKWRFAREFAVSALCTALATYVDLPRSAWKSELRS
jgi:cyanuric acid amidohydrolase